MRAKDADEKNWYYEKLDGYCCRLTQPRRAILDVLKNRGGHLSARQIHKEALNEYQAVGLATIYRNLELLVRVGLVRRFDAGSNESMYEIINRPEEGHHHHLICKRCHKVIDYSDSIDDEKDFLGAREKNLTRRYKFRIENHTVDFFGLCEECRSSSG